VKIQDRIVQWRVASSPGGPGVAFVNRQWPSARHIDEDGRDIETLCQIHCRDSYTPRVVRGGGHKPLTLSVRVGVPEHNRDRLGRFSWCKMPGEFSTLQDAKDAFERFVLRNKEHDWAWAA
jgi:hypothetical protein